MYKRIILYLIYIKTYYSKYIHLIYFLSNSVRNKILFGGVFLNPGKKFEQNFSKSIPDYVYFLRIKDSASSFSPNSKSRFTPNNPYDFLLFYNCFLFPMELKSTNKKSFSIQRTKEDTSKEIKYQQIESLTNANSFENIFAGFILDFRNENTYWMDINSFNNFLLENDKKSINIEDVKKYNGIIIDKNKIRVNYKYNIEKLLKDIIKIEKKG